MDIWYDQEVEPVADKICNLVKETFKVVAETSHQFEPQGRTIVFILSESHFTVHTYPEHNYLSLDIYICNPEFDLAGVADEILELAPSVHYNAALDSRGVREA
jgi:S-adenosylmethionine/arginine decarboxylase-like enzyme